MNNIFDADGTPPNLFWIVRRHPWLSSLICGVFSPITLLYLCGDWWRDLGNRQDTISGFELIEEGALATIVTTCGAFVLLAYGQALYSLLVVEKHGHWFAGWWSGTCSIVSLISCIVVCVITFMIFDDDE